MPTFLCILINKRIIYNRVRRVINMRLFHATKTNNYESIKRTGLKLDKVSSRYGKTPEHKAVYLYCEYNVDVVCDLIDMFGEIDVFEVIRLDKSKLIPDEDSGSKTWSDSIEKMGTVAYKGEIPAKDIKYMGRFKSESEYIAWSKLLAK